MRIKLTANSNVSLPAHLSNIDISYGYTLLGNNAVNPWKVKIAAGVDRALSFIKPLSTEQKEFIQSVTESAKFLDSHIPESDSHLDDLQIQLNIKTPLSEGMLKVARLMQKFSQYVEPKFKDKVNKTVNSLGMMSNPYLVCIYTQEKIMYLGSNFFKFNLEGNSAHYIQDNLGMKKLTNFFLYHEASHSFEFTNTKNFGDKFCSMFRHIYDNTRAISHYSSLRNDLNSLISSNKELGLNTVSSKYSQEIGILYQEIYADTGAILLQRNQDIIEGKHSRENDLLNINTIIEARNIEQQFCDQKLMSSDYPSKFDHFTSPGLEYLRDNCYTLPKKNLSQEEIHNITHKAVEQGISRMLIATSVANRNNLEDLKTIFSAKLEVGDKESSTTFLLPIKVNPNIYVDTMTELKKYAGEEWVKQFTDNIHLIHDQNMDDKKKATWHAAFFPKKFKQDLENNSVIKTQIDDIFGHPEKIKQSELNIALPNKEVTGLRIGSVLDKFRKPTASNPNLPKPH